MLLISLGTIVKTDFAKSLVAFQNLSNSLGLGIDVRALLPALKPVFTAFNQGEITKKQFQEALLSVFLAKEVAKDEFLKLLLSQDEYSEESLETLSLKKEFLQVLRDKSQFFTNFELAWNVMCIVDDEAYKLLSLISNCKKQGIKIIIYSDTNEMHFHYLSKFLRDAGLEPDEIQTTFKSQLPKVQLMEAIIVKNSKEECTVVLGSTDNIENEFLRKMTFERDELVLQAAQRTTIRTITLEGPRLTEEDLQLALSLESRNTKIISLTKVLETKTSSLIGNEVEGNLVPASSYSSQPLTFSKGAQGLLVEEKLSPSTKTVVPPVEEPVAQKPTSWCHIL